MLSPQEAIKVLLSHGYSQERIAQIANVKQPTISRIIALPDRYPSYRVVDALRRAVENLKEKDFEQRT